MIDAGFKAHLTTFDDYKSTCGSETWDATMYYINKLKQKKTKIAFFSSTPQGGGVALMRHALVRFARLAGVDLTWYGTQDPVEKQQPKSHLGTLADTILISHHSSEAAPGCLPNHQEHAQHSSRCQRAI